MHAPSSKKQYSQHNGLMSSFPAKSSNALSRNHSNKLISPTSQPDNGVIIEGLGNRE